MHLKHLLAAAALIAAAMACGGVDEPANPNPAAGADAGADAGSKDPEYWTGLNFDGGSPDATPPACVGEAQPLGEAWHVDEGADVTYAHHPPASGNHWGCWAPWGISSRLLPPERWVHNLEHGGIVLLYRCPAPAGGHPEDAFKNGNSPCPDEAAKVKAFYDQAKRTAAGDKRYLVTAIEEMPKKYAAISWGWTLERDELDTDEFNCFADLHLQQAPEDIGGQPPTSSCAQVWPP